MTESKRLKLLSTAKERNPLKQWSKPVFLTPGPWVPPLSGFVHLLLDHPWFRLKQYSGHSEEEFCENVMNYLTCCRQSFEWPQFGYVDFSSNRTNFTTFTPRLVTSIFLTMQAQTAAAHSCSSTSGQMSGRTSLYATPQKTKCVMQN